MQKILTLSNISEISGITGDKVQKLLSGDRHQIEFFCSFEDFDLLSFNYHEIKDKQDSKITIYLDKENIFFICHEEPMLRVAEELAGTARLGRFAEQRTAPVSFFCQAAEKRYGMA